MTIKFSSRLLIAWSALAVAGGCGQLLGLGDYEIDPTLRGAAGEGEGGNPTGNGGSNSASSGKAGSKPTAGEGAGGRPMPQGGAGGETPTPGGGAAGAAVGGESGAGGAPPAAKFTGCDGTPFDGNEAILRSCMLRVSCMIFNYPTDSISRCLSQDAQNTYEGTKCTLDATSCDDITACEGEHIENTFCTGKAAGTYCNAATNEMVTCGDYPFARDCTKEGGTCKDFGPTVDLDGNGTTAACSLPNVTTCADTSTDDKCGGPGNGYLYQCQGTVAYGHKCSNFAASCETLGSDTGCFYPLSTCSAAGVTCANDRATWCDGANKAIFDCGAVGLTCQTQGDYNSDGGHQCTAPGCTQDDLDICQESCVKGTSKINLCYGGSKLTVDCKDYGFKKCGEYDFDCTELGSGFAMNDCIRSTDTIHYADCEY